MRILVQPEAGPQNGHKKVLFICVHCNRISFDRSTWFQSESVGDADGAVYQNSLCVGCSKTLFPQFYK